MGEYLLKSRADLVLPREVFYQCKWIVKDMDRLKLLAADAQSEYMLSETNIYLDRIEEGLFCDPVGKEANFKIDCIHRALNAIPAEYRDMVITNICDRQMSMIAHENTIKHWKQIFLSELAINLRLI